MILDLDDTRRRILGTELALIPGCPVYTEEQLSFDLPTEADAVSKLSQKSYSILA